MPKASESRGNARPGKSKGQQRKPGQQVTGRARAGRSNPASAAERTFEKWHDFPPSAKTPVKMGRTISGELVMLGECDGILYASDKWHPGTMERYIHKFARGHKPVLLYDPVNHYLIIPGPPVSGKWKVTKDGLVD
jgi:hypothetical protein